MKWFFTQKNDPSASEQTGKHHYSSSVFNFTWEQVVIAFWLRYPNPFSSHVLSEDVLDRYVTKDKKLVTKRLLSKTNPIPKWGERLIRGPKHVLVLEESVVDLQERSLTTYTNNIGYTKIMTVDEKCWYRPAPTDSSSTELSRTAYMESHVYGFSKAIQAFGVERYKRNTNKTTKGFLYVLEHLFPSTENPDKAHDLLSSRMLSLAAKAEHFRESAKRAKELARQKTSNFLHSGVKQPSGQGPSM